MSNNNSLSYKRAARILTVACGLLFSIFSIVYLFVLQKDVVGALHYSLSQGKTHYSPLVGAIITFIFIGLLKLDVMGMLVASFRVPYRGMPIIACYQFQAAKLRFFPETTKYFLFFLRNI